MLIADTIIINGKVATVDRAFSFKEAIAVKNGWIIDVGTNAEIKRYKGPGTKVIDLEGKLILPAAHDAHIHAVCFVLNNLCCNCGAPAVNSLEDLKRVLSEEVKRLKPGEWIRGVNLNPHFPELQGRHVTRWDIDSVTGDHPAIIQDWTAHGALVNSKALEISEINRDTPDPDGGKLLRDESGEPTGYLQEAAATFLVYKYVPLWTDEEISAAIMRVQSLLNSEGYSGYTESTLGPANNLREYGAAGERSIFLYKKLADEGRLTARVSIGFYSGVDGVQSYERLKHDLDTFSFPEIRDPLWFDLKTVKIFCDGVHLFHTGWMLDDYYDAPGNRGRSCLGDAKASDEEQAEELSKMIELAHCRGFQAGIHAIGDRAVEETIKAIIAVKEKFPQNDLRHYIIHAESLGWPHQAKRAARYKIPYSVQPAFAAHEIEPTIGCIGPRGERCFDLRTPLDEGVVLCGGSDAIAGNFPHWRLAVQSAVTRRSLLTGKVYSPELRISVAEAVRMFTINAVWQERMEDKRGSIEPGKVADFQVLDRDIFTIPAEEIGGAKVLMTMVGGKTVFEK